MPLIQFNVYFRDYLCMLIIILVHTPDSQEAFPGNSSGRRENSIVVTNIS